MQLCKGTVLYGEFVKEINTLKTDAACTSDEKMPFRYTLQVIDALQLGDISLGNMKFKERFVNTLIIRYKNKYSDQISVFKCRLCASRENFREDSLRVSRVLFRIPI